MDPRSENDEPSGNVIAPTGSASETNLSLPVPIRSCAVRAHLVWTRTVRPPKEDCRWLAESHRSHRLSDRLGRRATWSV